MRDPRQRTPNLFAPDDSHGAIEVATSNEVDEDELARQELARITPSNEELLKIVAKCGPLPGWLDEDELPPF